MRPVSEPQDSFALRFPTEEACVLYLIRLRWPNGFQCPACGWDKAWDQGHGLFRCRRCRRRVSVTSGTLFHRTRKSLRTWFRAIWEFANHPSRNAGDVQRASSLTRRKTAWTWTHKLRSVMFPPGRDLLGGTVILDEAFLTVPRGSRPSLVVVGVQHRRNQTPRIRLKPVSTGKNRELLEAVQRIVLPGSELWTDELAAYRELEPRGFRHCVVFPGAHLGVNPVPPVATLMESIHSFLTRTYAASLSTDYLALYLDEFAFRFNAQRDASPEETFARLVRNAVETASPPPFS